MADNNSLLSSKKLLSSLLGGDRQEDSTVIAPDGTNVLRNRSNSKGITEVIEDDNKDLLRVLKRGFGLDEFERPSEARVDQSDDGSGGNSGSGFLSKIGSILAGVGSTIAAAAGAALTLAIPAIAVALAAAVGTAVGAALYKILPKSAQDAIGSAAMRAGAGLGNETDQRLVNSDNERIRQQYVKDVHAAADKGLSAASVPVPVEIQGEVGADKTAMQRARYAADLAYGKTIGKALPGKNKSLERANAYQEGVVADYVNNVGEDGKLRSLPANRSAEETSAGHLSDTQFADGLMERIASGEKSKLGYDSYYTKSKVKPPKPLSEMTIGEVKEWQRKSIAAGSESTAAGAYQIVYNGKGGKNGSNINDFMHRAGLKDSDMFSPENQKKMAYSVIKNKVEGFRAGKVKAAELEDAIAGRYAGTKGSNNRGAHDKDGLNRATVDISGYLAANGPVKARPQMATEPLPEPVEPVRVASVGDGGGGGGGGGGSAGPGSSASALSLDNMLDIPSDDALTSLLSGKI